MSERLSVVAPAEEWFEKHWGLIESGPQDHEREVAELSAKIRRCREAIYSLRKDWVEGRLDKEQLEFEKSRFEQEIRLLEERLAEKKAQAPRQAASSERHQDVREALNDLLELNYDDEEAFDELHLILKKLIASMAVSGSGVVTVRTTFRADSGRPAG